MLGLDADKYIQAMWFDNIKATNNKRKSQITKLMVTNEKMRRILSLSTYKGGTQTETKEQYKKENRIKLMPIGTYINIITSP